jgi:hypothetical protein
MHEQSTSEQEVTYEIVGQRCCPHEESECRHLLRASRMHDIARIMPGAALYWRALQ